MVARCRCAWAAVPFVAIALLWVWAGGGCSSGTATPTAAITGTVVSAADPDLPIADAYVYVPLGARGLGTGSRQNTTAEIHTYTDADGRFTLTGLAPGDRALVVEPPAGSGFGSLEVAFTAAPEGELGLLATLVPSELAGRVASVAVTPATATVGSGATLQCSARVTDANGDPMQLVPTWTVLGDIGTVDASGLFRAGAATGSGTVTATVGAASASCDVTVTGETTGTLGLSVGFPSAGARLTTATQSVVATVLRESDGADLGEVTLTPQAPSAEITGLASGTRCRVDAAAYPNPDGTGIVQGTTSTSVSIPWGGVALVQLTLTSSVASVEVAPTNPNPAVGSTLQLTPTARDEAGSAVLVSDSWLWASDSELVATVNGDGLVTAVAEGVATIRVTETDSGVAGSTIVTVGSPSLSVSPTAVSFGRRDTYVPLTVVTDAATPWTISNAIPWLSVTPASDVGGRDVDLDLDRTGLDNGDYEGSLSVAAGSATVTVPVSMSVRPILLVNPTDLDFETTTTQLGVEIKNEGSGYFEWTTIHTLGWLRIEPPSGTTDAVVQVTADRGELSQGIHQGTFTVVSNDVDVEVCVAVVVP